MAFFAKRASSCLKALGQAGARSAALFADQASPSGTTAAQLARQCKRYGSGGGHHGETVTYEGLTVPKPDPKMVWTGKVMGAVMWFWIFYRFYWDYDTFLFGHAAHFEHEEHSEAHGDSHAVEHH